MNEPSENELIQVLIKHTAAMDRLTKVVEGLIGIIYTEFIEPEDDDVAQTYLNGKPRG
ncbi:MULTISPECIES: hypothetical protein [Pantoea]|uniref:hypothetical protein n=1 Tax=Pantoea TaxID=53335 RepID=UPI001419AB2C|nr:MULTISPECIES: hypothetical protein [Pantoea]